MKEIIEEQKEKTTPSPSIGVDEEQSIHNNTNIIPQSKEDIKDNLIKNKVENLIRAAKEKPNSQEEKSYSPLINVTMTHLFDMVFPPKLSLVTNFLVAGTYILAGSPKVGKSYFIAQLAYHVSLGLPFLGREVSQSEVLYLGLEDSYQRLQHRLFQMYGAESTHNLRLSVCCEGISSGLIEQLTDFLEEHPKTKLIIIDTLQKVRGGTYEKCNYANDYEVMGCFKNFADTHNIALIFIHHTRKLLSDDSFDMISGTNGIFGAVDGGFILRKKERTHRQAILEITSRDFADQKILVEKAPATCIWNFVSEENEDYELPPHPVLQKISDFLSTSNIDWEGSPTELSNILNLEVKPQALTRILNVNVGVLQEKFKISYRYQRKHEGRVISLGKLP